MWQPGSLIFDEEQAAVVLNDADDIIAAEGVYKYVTLAGGDTVRKPDTENGRLFAAAPELLESLTTLLARFIGHIESGDCGDWDADTEPVVTNALAAINKATGH